MLAALDEEGFIVQVSDSWNNSANQNGGLPQSLGVGVNYLEVCRRSAETSVDAKHVLEGVRSVMIGAVPHFTHEYRCDRDNEMRWYSLTAIPHPNIRGGAIITHKDDTQARQTELRFGALLDSVRAIVWRAEMPGFKTTFASRQAEEILGFPAENWISDPDLWRKQLHPDDSDRVLRYASEEVEARRSHSFEYRIFHADGSILWLRNIVNVIVEDGQVKELVGISTDVTERKKIEEERDWLQLRILRSQEEERFSIARELHDDIGQSLAMLGIKLEMLKKQMAPDSQEAIQLKEAHASATKIAMDVQRLSHGLHSTSLNLMGLKFAVAQHCSEYAKSSSAKIQVDLGNIPDDLDKEISLCMYRVLQESLRNITKHSHAKNVTVRLDAIPNELCLIVSDDGVGFDTASNSAGLGLASMTERIRLTKGAISVSSVPGKGTQVMATAPIAGNGFPSKHTQETLGEPLVPNRTFR